MNISFGFKVDRVKRFLAWGCLGVGVAAGGALGLGVAEVSAEEEHRTYLKQKGGDVFKMKKGFSGHQLGFQALEFDLESCQASYGSTTENPNLPDDKPASFGARVFKHPKTVHNGGWPIPDKWRDYFLPDLSNSISVQMVPYVKFSEGSTREALLLPKKFNKYTLWCHRDMIGVGDPRHYFSLVLRVKGDDDGEHLAVLKKHVIDKIKGGVIDFGSVLSYKEPFPKIYKNQFVWLSYAILSKGRFDFLEGFEKDVEIFSPDIDHYFRRSESDRPYEDRFRLVWSASEKKVVQSQEAGKSAPTDSPDADDVLSSTDGDQNTEGSEINIPPTKEADSNRFGLRVELPFEIEQIEKADLQSDAGCRKTHPSSGPLAKGELLTMMCEEAPENLSLNIGALTLDLGAIIRGTDKPHKISIEGHDDKITIKKDMMITFPGLGNQKHLGSKGWPLVSAIDYSPTAEEGFGPKQCWPWKNLKLDSLAKVEEDEILLKSQCTVKKVYWDKDIADRSPETRPLIIGKAPEAIPGVSLTGCLEMSFSPKDVSWSCFVDDPEKLVLVPENGWSLKQGDQAGNTDPVYLTDQLQPNISVDGADQDYKLSKIKYCFKNTQDACAVQNIDLPLEEGWESSLPTLAQIEWSDIIAKKPKEERRHLVKLLPEFLRLSFFLKEPNPAKKHELQPLVFGMTGNSSFRQPFPRVAVETLPIELSGLPDNIEGMLPRVYVFADEATCTSYVSLFHAWNDEKPKPVNEHYLNGGQLTDARTFAGAWGLFTVRDGPLSSCVSGSKIDGKVNFTFDILKTDLARTLLIIAPSDGLKREGSAIKVALWEWVDMLFSREEHAHLVAYQVDNDNSVFRWMNAQDLTDANKTRFRQFLSDMDFSGGGRNLFRPLAFISEEMSGDPIQRVVYVADSLESELEFRADAMGVLFGWVVKQVPVHVISRECENWINKAAIEKDRCLALGDRAANANGAASKDKIQDFLNGIL